MKVFDFRVIESALIKYFNCVYNYQIFLTKLNKILKPSAYGTLQSKSYK